MTIKFELPTTGNWLNWDLYTENPLTEDDQTNSLNYFREELKAYISKEGHKDYLYLLNLQLFKDKGSEKFYRMVGNLVFMPKNNFSLKGFDFEHLFAVLGAGGEAAGGATSPIPPVGPKGWVGKTPFIPILNEPIMTRSFGALIQIHE
jgi:hypothetical protein